MNTSNYELYEKTMNREDSPELQRAEAELANLLRKIDDRELREEIDRAAGTVGRLREAEGYEAGCRRTEMAE